MREALWSDDITVDFEQSLTSAIKKLRQSLDDSASNPRFIETVARRGYRFIAPVMIRHVDTSDAKTALQPVLVKTHVSTDLPASLTAPAETSQQRSGPRTQLLPIWSAIFVSVLVLLAVLYYVQRTSGTVAYRISQATSSNHVFTGTQYSDLVPL